MISVPFLTVTRQATLKNEMEDSTYIKLIQDLLL